MRKPLHYVPSMRLGAPKPTLRALATLAWILGGCAHKWDSREPVVVFAASSLTDAFTVIAADFERQHPDVDVQLVFAGSHILRLQIEQGAGAHIFASADAAHTGALEAQGLLSSSELFATNELVIVTPREDRRVRNLATLDRAQRLVIGTAASPIGALTRQLFDRVGEIWGADAAASLRARVVSEENNVRLVRAKVNLGEADAAVVYRTDSVGAEALRVVTIPARFGLRAHYRIGVAHGAPERARAFVRWVLSESGRARLRAHGFAVDDP